MADYLQGVAKQAEDRDSLMIRSIDAYMLIFRQDRAVHACFMPGELHLSIPDEAFYHPVVKDLQEAIINTIVLDNVSRWVDADTHCFRSMLILCSRILPRTIENRRLVTKDGISSGSRCTISN